MEFYYHSGGVSDFFDEMRLKLTLKGDQHDMDVSGYRFHHFALNEEHLAAVCVGPSHSIAGAAEPCFDAPSAQYVQVASLMPSWACFQ